MQRRRNRTLTDQNTDVHTPDKKKGCAFQFQRFRLVFSVFYFTPLSNLDLPSFLLFPYVSPSAIFFSFHTQAYILPHPSREHLLHLKGRMSSSEVVYLMTRIFHLLLLASISLSSPSLLFLLWYCQQKLELEIRSLEKKKEVMAKLHYTLSAAQWVVFEIF